MRSEPRAPEAPTGRKGGAPRRLAGLAAAALVSLGAATTAQAALTPTGSALDVARAIADHPAFVVGAEFEQAPPAGNSAAVSTDQLAGFWTSPETPDFAILSTGDTASVVPDTDPPQLARAGDDLGGQPFRGGSEHDVTILRIEVQAPQRASCMQFDYRFLTDESASGEPPTGPFDDAFIAELDSSSWLAVDGAISAPDSFATTPGGQPVTLASTELFLSPVGALGTAFDRATPIWQAWTPVRGGERHSLYLTILDSVDPERDSAVFVDHLTFGKLAGDSTSCTPGPTLVTQVFADQPQSLIGGANGYRILVEAVGGPLPGAGGPLNTPIDPDAVASITSSLAPGFAYVPRSTSGGTRNDPSTQGPGRLTWTGPFATTTTLPEESIELRFGVFAPSKAGTYTNSTTASVPDRGYFLLPSGPSAPIDVVPPSADLGLTHKQSPSPARLDEKVELALVVTNHGPQPARGVVLEAKLPPSLSGVKVSSTQGACALDGSLVCKLGSLLPETSATVGVIGRLTGAELSLGATVTAAELDTDLSNNSLAANAAVVAAATEPVTPVVGDTLATEAKKGTVKVKQPDGKSFVELDSATAIPVGTKIDARKGEVKITTADEDGDIQAAHFARGKFVVRQQDTGLTTLKLLGGDFSKCPARGKGKKATRETQRFIKDSARRKKRVIRRLWGRGKGKFRTRGRYAAATVRGTVWRTVDRCDGTLIRVKRGVVIVRDVNRKRSVKVRAGQQYLVVRSVGNKGAA